MVIGHLGKVVMMGIVRLGMAATATAAVKHVAMVRSMVMRRVMMGTKSILMRAPAPVRLLAVATISFGQVVRSVMTAMRWRPTRV